MSTRKLSRIRMIDRRFTRLGNNGWAIAAAKKLVDMANGWHEGRCTYVSFAQEDEKVQPWSGMRQVDRGFSWDFNDCGLEKGGLAAAAALL